MGNQKYLDCRSTHHTFFGRQKKGGLKNIFMTRKMKKGRKEKIYIRIIWIECELSAGSSTQARNFCAIKQPAKSECTVYVPHGKKDSPGKCFVSRGDEIREEEKEAAKLETLNSLIYD